MPLALESLRKQLSETETEFEQVRAHLYRCDGAIQTLKHLIADAEASDAPNKPGVEAPPRKRVKPEKPAPLN